MNVIIHGCGGKMGQALEKVIYSDENTDIIAGVDLYKLSADKYPIFKSLKEISNNITKKADVLIDFSNPSALDGILEYSTKQKIPAVICTTGFDDRQVAKVKEHVSWN